MEGAVVVQAHRYALSPTPTQERLFAVHAGASRVAHNFLLAAVKANLDQRGAERTYGIPDDALTPLMGWSAPALQRFWNQRKHEAAPWWTEVSKHAFQTGCANLSRALSNWARARQHGDSAQFGFPRFKSKHRSTPSFKFSDGVRIGADRRHVVLPRIGSVRLHHSTRKLARRIEAGTARITGTTVSFRQGRWWVSFTVRVTRTLGRPAHVKAGAPVVGIDLGVRDLIVAATPDGTEIARIPAPPGLRETQAKLRSLQRKAARQQGPYDTGTKTRREPSAGWRRTQNRIARLQHKVANHRATHLHTATARLAQAHNVIGIETLAPRNMMSAGGTRKRGLNRSLANASFGELVRQLAYKADWYGATLVRADRFYPSTKTCSTCGTVKDKLPLHTRTYQCDNCELVIDRDLNAAINLARLAAAHVATAADPVAGFDTGGAKQKTSPREAAGDEAGTLNGLPGPSGASNPKTGHAA